jgi:two-component system, OmpR family, response regulator
MRILIVDDDPQIREVLTIALERAGMTVIKAADGQSALRMAARDTPDLMVLDIGLPEMDGLEVCRRIRATSALPILFLTAQDDEVDRILGLEMGADDYVTKPFSPRELVARVRAILKRSTAQPPRAGRIDRGLLSLDATRHICTVRAHPVDLTPTEMAFLARILQHPDHVVTRAQLCDSVWGPRSAISDRTVDSHLRNLRRKLGQAGCPDAVETVHGVGVRMGACLAR